MKNILITGGAGFIGRSLKKELLSLGYEITLLDKKEEPLNLNKNTTYIQGDICDQERMLSLFHENSFDGIVHLAAVSRVEEAKKNPQECKRCNIEGIQSLLHAIELSGQQSWLIFGSSREVYGNAFSLPVSEDSPRIAVNIYGETKIKGEQLFRDFFKKCEGGVNCVIVRFSNVYGNKHDIFDRVIPRFIRAIATEKNLTIEGGEQVIDFIHIQDVVKGIISIIAFMQQSTKAVQEDFNLCSGVGKTLYQLVKYIEFAIEKKALIEIVPKRNYNVLQFVGDTSKIKNRLDFQNFISLQKGIALCIDEYCCDLN